MQLSEVEMRLVDELRARHRRVGGIGEVVAQGIADLAQPPVDPESDASVSRAEDGAYAQ
jgi:hypothetical protein